MPWRSSRTCLRGLTGVRGARVLAAEELEHLALDELRVRLEVGDADLEIPLGRQGDRSAVRPEALEPTRDDVHHQAPREEAIERFERNHLRVDRFHPATAICLGAAVGSELLTGLLVP